MWRTIWRKMTRKKEDTERRNTSSGTNLIAKDESIQKRIKVKPKINPLSLEDLEVHCNTGPALSW